MGLLYRRGTSSKNPFRDNSIALLVSTLLLATPIFVLLFHCVYQTFYHKHSPWKLPHEVPISSGDGGSVASFLYVASYSGTVTTLNFTRAEREDAPVTLERVSSTEGCAGSPSWLTLDHIHSVLYCTDEGIRDDKNGSLASFRTGADGRLTPLDKVETVLGPVSAVVYGEHGNGLAVAHYGGSAFSTWDIKDPAKISSVQVRQFKLDEPGPDPSRQEASHPHAAVVDPSGQFVLVPDLGADLIRIYAVGTAGLELAELDPLVVAAGSGPRHVAFSVRDTKTFMYLVTELGNTIFGYKVVYDDGSIAFAEIWTGGIHGKGKHVPENALASEIIVSPDNRFLILSSRNENSLATPNFDTSNRTCIVSDPLISFEINAETGHLTLQEEVPCGGRFPRQFAINKAGSLVAVALQIDGRVVVIERDAETGKLDVNTTLLTQTAPSQAFLISLIHIRPVANVLCPELRVAGSQVRRRIKLGVSGCSAEATLFYYSAMPPEIGHLRAPEIELSADMMQGETC
ncbi:hypothetical protein FZEAL_6017 [Fusarium zealandicum]|uniref:6-phosphogluconolactonase n=1 Tax=Fusarium zealandicum TaxID=1053134 RepID=A0A8H4XJW8_9HYPO|nr:hypothetical protein FZEAL_6017 [Fusarium zealandicum]